MKRLLRFTICTFLGMAQPVWAASFPCEKTVSKVEAMICKDAQLSTLEEHLAQYYVAATRALGEGAQCLQEDQRSWLQNVRNACRDAACLKQAYLLRLSE